MTETAPKPSADTPVRAAVALVIALGGHAVALLAAYIAQWTRRPYSEGFQDYAVVLTTFFGVESFVGAACLIGGATLFRRGRRYTGLGLLGGWLIGLVILVVLDKIY